MSGRSTTGFWKTTLATPRAASGSLRTSKPARRAVPAGRRDRGRQHADRRRLARAVWPEQAEDLARGDLEVDALHRLDVAGVRLAQLGHLDDRAFGVVVRHVSPPSVECVCVAPSQAAEAARRIGRLAHFQTTSSNTSLDFWAVIGDDGWAMSRDATRQRILDTAERHFALYGFAGTSLRGITRDARVNVAAIHYHYGSKEQLLGATMERIVAPVNAERLRLLDEAIAAAGGAPSVEAILSAFLCPDLILIRDLGDRGVMMARFSGRSSTEPGEVVARVLRGIFGDLGDRFIDALAVAVPDVPRSELAWRLRCVVAIITYLLANTGHGPRPARPRRRRRHGRAAGGVPGARDPLPAACRRVDGRGRPGDGGRCRIVSAGPVAVRPRPAALTEVRLAELVAALSLASDLGRRPAHGARPALVSARHGVRPRASASTRRDLADVYDVALLRRIGCMGDAARGVALVRRRAGRAGRFPRPRCHPQAAVPRPRGAARGVRPPAARTRPRARGCGRPSSPRLGGTLRRPTARSRRGWRQSSGSATP